MERRTKTVVLDAAHGGMAPAGGSSPNNARAANGLLEKDLALDLARRVSRALNGGVRTLVTRDADVNLPLAARARLARDNAADVFLSLHFNGSPDARAAGPEIWVARQPSARTMEFARSLAERLARASGVPARGVFERNLGVLLPERHDPSTIASLVEIGFLTNREEAARLEGEAYRDELAAAIAGSIQAELSRNGVALALGAGAFTLTASVGSGGVNNGPDVEALKRRLTELGFNWVGSGTAMDAVTIDAIKLFQGIIRGAIHLERDPRRIDGAVDVPGFTYSWLQAVNAPHWHQIPRGSAADGYVNRSADANWGTDWMAEILRGAGAHYRDNHLAAHPGAPMTTGDVSLEHGGQFPLVNGRRRHSSHQTGLSCDVSLPRTGGGVGGVVWYASSPESDAANPAYDRAATRALLRALRAQPQMRTIWFNDRVLMAEGLCTFQANHHNHIHFNIGPPARGAATTALGPAPAPARAFSGEGSPFAAEATERCWRRCSDLMANASRATNPNRVSGDRLLSETGIRVDGNPYVGITREEIEAVVRAAFESHEPPETLLALWAKEGSTASRLSPVRIAQATSSANAATLCRCTILYEDLGSDEFLVTTRPPGGGDNVWDSSDSAAAAHETRFRTRVRELVDQRLLSRDISADINAELRVAADPAGGFNVTPTVSFYALSLLLMDALFTRFRRNRYPQADSLSAAMNYIQWNMGTARFRQFLESADAHRREPAHLRGGQPITIEEWSLHTRPRSNEWRQPRANAIRFLHYIESYADIFAANMNLIRPGTDELREIESRTASAGGASVTLNYGVPGGTITDPFYRSADEKRRLTGRSTGRSLHAGIDVSLSNASGGGADDDRRGLPVYALIRTTIPLSELNAARAARRNSSGDYTAQSGLGISGTGDATLDRATVRVQPWAPSGEGDYGGVIGLACVYSYTKNDGSSGQFTLYVEYLHLITHAYLPKRGDGSVISAADWAATGKGIGFGPRMVNNARLTPADLDGSTPLLVGYLGATQFPHVHIQAGYSTGAVNYVRSPRFDPTVVLIGSASATFGLGQEDGPAADIEYEVRPGQEYGPRWRTERPPGLPATARQTSAAGAATPWIQELAREENLGDEFVRTVSHLAETESEARFARPADRFDSRPQAERPAGRPRITAWGAFQYNRDAWRSLPGVANTAFPWEATAREEIAKPVRKYAALFREVREAGGTAVDGARAIRLFHRSPAAHGRFIRAARSGGFTSAWSGVPAAHRNVVDARLRAAGVLPAAQALSTPVSLSYDVPLHPQPTKSSCWAGAMSMIVSYHTRSTLTPEALAQSVGRSLYTSYGWDMLESVRDHFGFHEIPLPSNICMVPEPQEWYEWLRTLGPLWVTVTGNPSHAVVVHGIEGDLTPERTRIKVLNPWNIRKAFDNDPVDFHPDNDGLAETLPFSQFAQDFSTMGLDDYGNWRVLYIGIAGRPTGQSLGGGASENPFERAIRLFGGAVVLPSSYANTVQGFQDYLTATGVRNFSAVEMTRPNHPEVARRLGYETFLPQQDWWPRGAALALIADQIRSLIGEPIRMRNWWRPEAYNTDPAVGGAQGSDHVTAHAVDLDYSSSDSRRRAERWLKDLRSREPWLEMSLGLGDRTTHVGILSPRGAREWPYAGYSQSLEEAGAADQLVYENVREHQDPSNFPINLPEGGRGIDRHRFTIPAGMKLSRWQVEAIEASPLSRYEVTQAPERGAEGEAAAAVDWSHAPYGKLRYSFKAYASADGTSPSARVQYDSPLWAERTRDAIRQGIPIDFAVRGRTAEALNAAITTVRRQREGDRAPATAQEAITAAVIITIVIAAAVVIGAAIMATILLEAMRRGYDVKDTRFRGSAGEGASRLEEEMVFNLTRPASAA